MSSVTQHWLFLISSLFYVVSVAWHSYAATNAKLSRSEPNHPALLLITCCSVTCSFFPTCTGEEAGWGTFFPISFLKAAYTREEGILRFYSRINAQSMFPVISTCPTLTHLFLLVTLDGSWPVVAGSYLLFSCRHGNISSDGSTGTGSCGAGLSDTPCWTWKRRNKSTWRHAHPDVLTMHKGIAVLRFPALIMFALLKDLHMYCQSE